MELQGRVAELKRQGLSLAAVSYDPVAVLADFSKRRGITFPLLSDPGSATIKRYGIFNTTVPETNQQSYGIPFPGTLMLNTQGVVTSRFFEQAYQERSTVGSIMARLGNKVNVQATTVSSPQLEMTSFATDSTVAPGTQFSLVLDVRPARGVHVYAPGVTGYKPIALSVEAQPGLVTRGAQYPPSEDYHFKPLERTRAGLSAAVSDRAGRERCPCEPYAKPSVSLYRLGNRVRAFQSGRTTDGTTAGAAADTP